MLTCGGNVILVKCTAGRMMEIVQHGYQYPKVQQVFKVLREHREHRDIKVIKVIKVK